MSKQFKDFDHIYHEKTFINIENSTFEIWHMINAPYEKIKKSAKKYIEHEKQSGRKPKSTYRLDFRTF